LEQKETIANRYKQRTGRAGRLGATIEGNCFTLINANKEMALDNSWKAGYQVYRYDSIRYKFEMRKYITVCIRSLFGVNKESLPRKFAELEELSLEGFMRVLEKVVPSSKDQIRRLLEHVKTDLSSEDGSTQKRAALTDSIVYYLNLAGVIGQDKLQLLESWRQIVTKDEYYADDCVVSTLLKILRWQNLRREFESK